MLRPKLTYVGDCARDLLWRTLGPDTAGGYVRVVEAVYDPSVNLTRASVEPIMPDFTGYISDPFGQVYAPVVPGDE